MQKKVYVKIDGWISKEWFAGFDKLEITQLENGETLIYGSVKDSSAFYGLLEKIRNMGFKLVYLKYK